jgi:hypothetical protein
MSSIFGGTKRTESSVNTNNPALTAALSPVVGSAGTAAGMANSLLSGGFEGYKDKAGFDWASKEGSKGILGNAAARGLLRSGSTGKALVNYGNNQANTYLKDYMSQLFNLGNLGISAGGVLSDSGKTSSGSSSTKPGLAGLIGRVASGGAAG